MSIDAMQNLVIVTLVLWLMLLTMRSMRLIDLSLKHAKLIFRLAEKTEKLHTRTRRQ